MAPGLRSDGRRWKELRRLNCVFDVVDSADGSCEFSIGRTRCIASVFGPMRRPQGSGRAGGSHQYGGSSKKLVPAVELKVSWAPFATQERRERGRTDRLIVELENALKATVESMLDTQTQQPTGEAQRFDCHSEIQVKVLVVEADGGVKSCCVNAVTCAVAAANLACGDLVVACGCTPYALATTLKESRLMDVMKAGPRLFLDPNNTEIAKFGELTLIVTISGEQLVTSLLCDAKMTPEDLEECIDTCAEGCKAIGSFMRTGIMDYMRKVASVSMH